MHQKKSTMLDEGTNFYPISVIFCCQKTQGKTPICVKCTKEWFPPVHWHAFMLTTIIFAYNFRSSTCLIVFFFAFFLSFHSISLSYFLLSAWWKLYLVTFTLRVVLRRDFYFDVLCVRCDRFRMVCCYTSSCCYCGVFFYNKKYKKQAFGFILL